MTKATGPRYTASKGSELDGCIDPQNDILCARGFEFGYIASVQEARSSSTDRDVVVSWIWQIHALCRWLTISRAARGRKLFLAPYAQMSPMRTSGLRRSIIPLLVTWEFSPVPIPAFKI